MQSRTLNKITREFFSNHPPLYEENTAEQKIIIDGLKEKIKENKNFTINLVNFYSDYYDQKEKKGEKSVCIKISNPHPTGSWYDSANLEILFENINGRNKLSIKPAYEDHSYNFSGKAEDLFAFFAIILDKYRELDNNKTKAAKIKKLKRGAILARIKEVAREKQVNFNLEEFTNKLKLSIQIGKKGILTVDILYSKFQQEMGKIAGIVDASLVLEKSGIVANLNFKSTSIDRELRHFTRYDEP